MTERHVDGWARHRAQTVLEAQMAVEQAMVGLHGADRRAALEEVLRAIQPMIPRLDAIEEMYAAGDEEALGKLTNVLAAGEAVMALLDEMKEDQ